jgi:hypothetical protein
MPRKPVNAEVVPVLSEFVQKPRTGAVELHDEYDPRVWVQDPDDPNKSIQVRRSQLQPAEVTPPRDMTPQPLIDPIAQRMVAAGAGVGLACWGGGHLLAGLSQLVAACTGMGSAAGAIALLLLAAKLTPTPRSKKGGDTINVTNHNRFGGRSTTRVK